MGIEKHWSGAIHALLRAWCADLVSYVPDAGHASLINLCRADRATRTVPLATEEEGVALATGAWLGGTRHVMLMQSSGVGNCVNMFAMLKTCQVPFLTLVTMRGDFGEFHPFQMPMGQGTPGAFGLMDFVVLRADRAEDVAPTVEAGLKFAFNSYNRVAVLLGQRLLGAKDFRTTRE
jgi:sulfopyruvate decarboxylase TPP-binding subunit